MSTRLKLENIQNLKNQKSNSVKNMTSKEKGYFYEEKSIQILKSKGYIILEKNYTIKGGEIDIIAKKDNCIIFFEVKYRSDDRFGNGIEAITLAKRKRIYKTAKKFLYNNQYYDLSCRFDFIIYTGDEYEWLENVIWGEEYGC